jgi:peptide deformylase
MTTPMPLNDLGMNDSGVNDSGNLTIVTLGHPVLHQVAQPVADWRSPLIQQLIDQLIALTVERNGVGIAAPQVGYGLQLMIIASHPTPRYPDAPTMAPLALLNPQIIQHSPTIVTDWEGCLSVPDQRAQVPRYESVTVAYRDRAGDTQTAEFTGFIARIFQHEFDHLRGQVFLDRLDPETAIVSEAEYQRLIAS